MSFTVNVEIKDEAFPALVRLVKNARRPAVRKVMGRAIATAVQDNFRKLDEERANKLGGQRTHFYGTAAKSVQQPELYGGDGIRVTITQIGIAQRYFGGDIVPVDKKWLTIPARAETYGHVATEFNDLHFVYFGAALAALVQNDQTRLSSKRVRGSVTEQAPKGEAGSQVFYWLVKHVHQEADLTVLPTDNELQTAAVYAGEEYIQRILEREAGE
jgi:hypothetical protein